MKSSDGSKDKATGMKSKRGKRLKAEEVEHQYQPTEKASSNLDGNARPIPQNCEILLFSS